MKRWLRRVRGAIGMGLTWALGWAPIGALVGLAVGLLVPAPPGVGLAWALTRNAMVFGALGLAGGTIFSAVLRLTEGQRRFDQLSLPRFAAWGVLGGLVLGGLAAGLRLWGPELVALKVAVATLLSAASATGSLALARGAEDRELLEEGDEVADVGLTAEDRQQLLGA